MRAGSYARLPDSEAGSFVERAARPCPLCPRAAQVDYTVEDPTDAFQKRRDVSDVAAARKARPARHPCDLVVSYSPFACAVFFLTSARAPAAQIPEVAEAVKASIAGASAGADDAARVAVRAPPLGSSL